MKMILDCEILLNSLITDLHQNKSISFLLDKKYNALSPQNPSTRSAKDVQKRESLKLIAILIAALKLRGEVLQKTDQFSKAAKDYETLVDFAGFQNFTTSQLKLLMKKANECKRKASDLQSRQSNSITSKPIFSFKNSRQSRNLNSITDRILSTKALTMTNRDIMSHHNHSLHSFGSAICKTQNYFSPQKSQN